MKVREVNATDDRSIIAELVFGTDPFIYPFWLYKVDDKVGAIARLIDTPGSVFYHDNLLVGEVDGKIIGVFGYLRANGDYSYDYRWEYLLQDNFPYVYENYFGPTIDQAKSLPEDAAVVLNLCIAENQRGHGYGQQLFSGAANLLHLKGVNHLFFDCLANNEPALTAYRGAGCEIVSRGFGFNGFDPKDPPEVVFLEKHF